MTQMTPYRETLYERYASTQACRESGPSLPNFRRQAQYLSCLLKDYLPQDKTTPCLDLGCGAGNFLFFLKSAGFQDILGVDISPEQVGRAHELSLPAVHDDLFAFLKSSDRKYGLISAIDLIEHLTKEEVVQLLNLVREALLPGGLFMARSPNGGSPLAGGVCYGDFTHETILTPNSATQLLLTAGFREVRCFEQKPLPIGLIASIRSLLWPIIRMGYKFLHGVETGGFGQTVMTQVFWIAASKP